VKAWQVKEIAYQLKPAMKETTNIIPLQNGVLAVQELADILGDKYVLGGLCRILSKIESPGVINHFGAEPVIVFGETNNCISDRVKSIKTLFDKAGIRSKIAEDIEAESWKKFISICVSGLLAITRSPYGVIRELPETRQLMVDLLYEVYQVSKKAGVAIDESFLEKTIAFTDTLPYDSTSSLARDVMEGKPSEIEYQNGTVVKLAEKFGVNVPVNRFVYNCILPMEKKARKE
jgi:2-dehydropantoate 2-reductase